MNNFYDLNETKKKAAAQEALACYDVGLFITFKIPRELSVSAVVKYRK